MRLAALFLLVSLPAAAAGLEGRIYLPEEKRFTTQDEVLGRAAKARAVLLGETHDNPEHHALQARVLARLVGMGLRPAVAFEMIHAGQAPALEAHLRASPKDGAGLGAALEWEKNGWPDWAFYRPIAQIALDSGLPILPANLSREQMRETSAQPVAIAPAMEAGLAGEIKDGHCGMLPDKAVPAMVRVQWRRDEAMAAALVEGIARNGTAVLIAGSGHARKDWAVPAHLPGQQVLSIAFVEVDPERTDPAAYDAPYDALWFTPRAQREDPCEAFKKQMENKG